MERHETESELRTTKRITAPALAVAGFVAIAAFLLLSGHRAHVLGVLPWLLLLACPLLHLLAHGGHGHDARRRGAGDRDSGGGA
jgi:hypothetical protein